MKTNDLIDALVADGTEKHLPIGRATVLALAVGLAVAFAIFLAGFGVRNDAADALMTWRFNLKVGIALALIAASVWLAMQLARPETMPGDHLWALAIPFALLVGGVALELATVPMSDWAARAVGSNSIVCLGAVTLLALGPLAAMLWMLRHGAPSAPGVAGAIAGLAAGACGACLYATHCFEDSPLFVATWYPIAIAMVSTAGAILGARLLRW